MTATSQNDQGVSAALERALGHAAPFSANELAAFDGHLTVEHARDLSALAACTSLGALTLFASDVGDLRILAHLPRLSRLEVISTSVGDLGGLAACTKLEELTLAFTLSEDAAPVLALPSLKEAELVGNPWSEESWDNLLERGEERSLRLGLSSEADWDLTRRIFERGYKACFGVYQQLPLFVRPGLPSFPKMNCDLTMVPRFLLEMQFQEAGFSPQGVFDMMGLAQRNESSPPFSFNYRKHLVFGFAEDARGWVAGSQLAEAEKAALNRFIDSFHSLLFYKELPAVLDAAEARHRVKLPRWFRELRQTVADVMPHHFKEFRLGELPRWDPPTEDTSRLWYEIRIRGVENEGLRNIIEINHLFPVGSWLPEGHKVFAIRLDDEDDHRVYSYTQDDIDAQGGLPPGCFAVVADSFAELLAHVSAVKLDTGQVIEVRPVERLEGTPV